MTTLQMLTMRTQQALGRLSVLQKRAEQVNAESGPVLRPALKELSSALEELRVANEQLQLHSTENDAIKSRLFAMSSLLDEFTDALPVACIWTNTHGEIDTANGAAAALLNVSAAHLGGRSLMLYLADRQKFI